MLRAIKKFTFDALDKNDLNSKLLRGIQTFICIVSTYIFLIFDEPGNAVPCFEK